MSPACSQAEVLPEIVAAILKQLDDTKALFAALQVNRLWADEATTLLWRENPPILALAHIKDAKGLQYYADKISSLRLLCSRDACQGHFKLQYLRFPRLGHISTNASGRKHEQLLLQTLQPRLQTFESSGGPISNYWLMQIQAHCPALRSLQLCSWTGTITATDLLHFLHDMPSLTSIHLWCNPKDSIVDEVFGHLASRQNLASFTIFNHITTLSLILRVQEEVDQPFPELVDLSIFSESKAFSQLSRHLTKLTKLFLHLVNVASNTVFDICLCTGLVSLELHFNQFSRFDAKSHFPPESLLALAKSCSRLQIFTVMHVENIEMNGGISNINDEVIQKFVALLPGLSCFRLRIKTNVTQRALRILGEGCPSMRICALEAKTLCLRLLESSGPVLFPRLEWLDLMPAAEGHSAAEIAKILHHHAPRAKKLIVGKSMIGGSYRFELKDYREIRGLER